MPKAANISGISVKLPPNMANGGWDIDSDSLLRFAKHFGITADIDIRFTTGNSNYGTHVVKNKNGRMYHSITLEQNQSEFSARETLLHELCHAIQVEKEKIESNCETIHQADSRFCVKYRRNKFDYEMEAELFAFDNSVEWGDVIY